MLNKATFLDPRFKSLLFLSESERSETIVDIELEMIDIYVAKSAQQDTVRSDSRDTTQEPPAKKKKEYRLLNLIDDVINPSLGDQPCNLLLNNL